MEKEKRGEPNYTKRAIAMNGIVIPTAALVLSALPRGSEWSTLFDIGSFVWVISGAYLANELGLFK